VRNYRNFVTETMNDPNEATEYLKASLEEYASDGDLEAFLTALRTVVDAQGGISELARKTELNRQTLYRTLSTAGNPRIKTLHSILSSLGFKLSVKPL